MTRRRPPAVAPVLAVPNASGGCSVVTAGVDLADEVEVRVVLAGGWVVERWGRCLVAGPAQVVQQVASEFRA